MSMTALRSIRRAVLPLGDACEIQTAQQPEAIEGAALIRLSLRFHIEERQIHGAATAAAGILGNISLREEYVLFRLGIKVFLHADVARVGARFVKWVTAFCGR